MKKKITLSELTDEQLSDILIGSITSYNVYLEEHASLEKNQLVAEIKKKINNKPFIPTNIKDINLTAQEVSKFIRNYTYDNIFDGDHMGNKIMDVYCIKYSDLNPFDLWDKAKEDGATIVNRELMSHFKNQLNYNQEQLKALVDCVNNNSPYPLILDKETLLEHDTLTQIKLKEIKASLVALEFSENLIPVNADYIDRKGIDNIDPQDKNSNLLLIKNGMFTIGKQKKVKYDVQKDGGVPDQAEFLACFNAFFKVENGEKVLHISFRGTEPKSYSVLKYALNDYMNMERHYDLMEPIINEIIIKAQEDHKLDCPLKVKISGHSLGAAMVEKFLEKNKDTDKVKFSGVAIASPGAENKSNIIIDPLEKTKYLKYPISIVSNTFVGLVSLALRKVDSVIQKSSKIKYLNFLKVGNSVLENVFKYKSEDSRLLNVNHENDLVPRIGSLAYKTQKTEITLSDINQDEGSMTNHKSYNYYGEIANEILKRPQMYEKFKSIFFIEEALTHSDIAKITNPTRLSLELSKISTTLMDMRTKYIDTNPNQLQSQLKLST